MTSRTLTSAFALLSLAASLTGAVTASVAVAGSVTACSADSSEGEDSAAAASELDQARAALQALGARVPGAKEQCQRCHDVNQATLKRWATDFGKANASLSNASLSKEAKLAALRIDPSNAQSNFTPQRLGFLAAGLHLENAAPNRELFSIVRGDDLAALRATSQMPKGFPGMSSDDYDKVIGWVKAGMPRLAEALPEGNAERETRCNEDMGALRDHARAMKSKSWATQNRDNRMKMFACSEGSATIDCFKQQTNGADVFPDAKTTRYGKNWSADGSTLRVLRVLDFHTYFWMRTSADGRFVANGLSKRGEPGGIISDLAARLDPSGPRDRDIFAHAEYDPDFWPDNQGFMYQGTPNGATFCPQSLLENPATTEVKFTESACSQLNAVGLYQTVGQRLGENSLADHFLVNSKYINDNGTVGAQINAPTFGADAKLVVHSMIARGNDTSSGYQIGQSTELASPYEGDTMMSRSASILVSRVAGLQGQLGYVVSKLDARRSGSGYDVSRSKIGRICLDGSKANLSFDERFLVTHQYRVNRQDEAEGSDVWIVDFVTGAKKRITKTGGGEFAMYPHFRSDGWLYFLVRDGGTSYVVASDAAIRMAAESP